MNTNNKNTFALFMKYKRKDLKWYQKLWNWLTGHKDRNWYWIPVGGANENK